jgi:cytochrome c2
MSINRLPILSWGTLTVSFGLVFSMPAVTLAFLFLWLDRQFGTHFLYGAGGGQPLLWQHLFWMWGHPWVYAIVLPAISMVSQILPVLCRRPLVGYTAVALATVSGAALIRQFGCGSCHTVPGISGADGLVGPPLTQMARRVYIAGVLRNSPDNMIAWLQDPQAIVSGNAMPRMGIDRNQAQDIAAYLYTLR